jgi:VCBS repeat-containing protein
MSIIRLGLAIRLTIAARVRGPLKAWTVAVILALGLVFPASVFADAPTADAKSPSTTEDTLATITLSGGDIDGDPLTFAIATGPTSGTLGNFGTPSCDGQTPSSCTETVDYTPNANANGSDSFTYTTNDGTTDSATALVSITITAVNDAPSFTKGTDRIVLEDSGAASFSGWATSISAGPSDETGQTLTFAVAATNTALFSAGPAVASNGTLTFTPAADANGTTSVTISISDNGGTSNGGDDTSADQTFNITITAVNDEPSFNAGGNQGVNEDSGAASVSGWATGASSGPSNEGSQTTSYLISSNTNSALFSSGPAVAANGTLSFTPAANRFGVATVGVEIHDNGGTSNGGDDTSAEQTFTITVSAVDDPPNAVNDTGLVVPQNAAATSLNVLANDTYLPDAPETLMIVAATQGAHGTVAITGGGTGLTYDPAGVYTGTDQFTYTIQDSGGALQDTATVALSVGKDIIAPVANPPVQSIRTGVTMNTTIGVRIAWSATDAGVGVAKYTVQVSVDGGAYATITLPTALTTSSNRLLTVNHTYRFRMRATDKNGNVSGYKYGPTFKVLRIQDGSGSIVYGGTWAVSSNINESGGTSHYAGTAGKTATITTTGRDFAFVGPRSSLRGTAQIYVDGVLAATINEQASTTSYRRVYWAVHFSTLTTHQIRVVVVGPSRIDLDCFLILR